MNELSRGFELFKEDDNDIVLPLVDEGTMDQLVGQRTCKQLKGRQYMVDLHHGKLNPLPPNWSYPKGITLIQLIYLWLLGGGREKMYQNWVTCTGAVVLNLIQMQECISN